MQTTNYIGFGNLVCQCGYVTGNINGDEVLILKQTNGSKTTITNVVENIVSGLLAGHSATSTRPNCVFLSSIPQA